MPEAGSTSMRTLAKLCPASASEKPKSVALKLRLPSSAITTSAFVPVGGVFGPTLTVTVAVAKPP